MPVEIKENPREPVPGMGWGIFARNIQRNGESWGDVADRVSLGSTTIHYASVGHRESMRRLIHKGAMLLSGRHLQHGDFNQPKQTAEKFTNCATAATTSLLFLLLLNGSGVGRCYDNDMMLVDWANLDGVTLFLDSAHADYSKVPEFHRSNLRDFEVRDRNVHVVQDSREGWAKAIELLETRAWRNDRSDIVLDFSAVRPEGSPIAGMQDRPASGPVPLMKALWLMIHYAKVARAEGWAKWKTCLVFDHLLAECVVYGGARRSARLAEKHWADEGTEEFIDIKEDFKVLGGHSSTFWLTGQSEGLADWEYSNLWSANNSVGIDQVFEDNRYDKTHPAGHIARRITFAQLNHLTGEPGILALHKLSQQRRVENYHYDKVPYVGNDHYPVEGSFRLLYSELAKAVNKKEFQYIVNPCAEIVLNVLGAFCVVADGAPALCDSLEEVLEMYRIMTRTCININLLPSVYPAEVRNTNRIGISMTGVLSFAWKFFSVTVRDLIYDHDNPSVSAFWSFMRQINAVVNREAVEYSRKVGLPAPLTTMAGKPAGTISKLFLLEEGFHVLPVAYMIRWVLYKQNDPKVQEFARRGYPVRDLKQRADSTIVGFPTIFALAEQQQPEDLVLARDLTPEEHFEWLRLCERNFIDGMARPEDTKGNQISYTIAFDAAKYDWPAYHKMMMDNVCSVKAVSVLPHLDGDSAYEYLPQEEITKQEYDELMANIQNAGAKDEDIDFDHLLCTSGACPIE